MCSRKNSPACESNVIAFPRRCRYSLDVISDKVVNGCVLIEACIPVTVLEALVKMLQPN